MLDKSRRVPRELFKTVFDGKEVRREYTHSPNFSLTAVNKVREKSRAAVSVSKKVSKSAVVRNKVRRRAYSVLRNLINEIGGGLYLVSAKKGADKISFKEIEREMDKLFSKFRLKK